MQLNEEQKKEFSKLKWKVLKRSFVTYLKVLGLFLASTAITVYFGVIYLKSQGFLQFAGLLNGIFIFIFLINYLKEDRQFVYQEVQRILNMSKEQ